MTWGEALLFLRARQEAERQRCQRLALIAWEQAALTARAVLDGSLGEVCECFPFWTEEEVRERRVEKCRALLEGLAGRSRGVPAGDTPAKDPEKRAAAPGRKGQDCDGRGVWI